MTLGLINANPVVHAKKERVARSEDLHSEDVVDPLEIYDILSRILYLLKMINYSPNFALIFRNLAAIDLKLNRESLTWNGYILWGI